MVVVVVVVVVIVVYCCCCLYLPAVFCVSFSRSGSECQFRGLNLQSPVAYFIAYYRSKQHRRVASSRQTCWFP